MRPARSGGRPDPVIVWQAPRFSRASRRRRIVRHAPDYSAAETCARVKAAHAPARWRTAPGRGPTIMRELRDVEVTVIEIDSDGDGFGDEELVIVEDTDG